MKNQEIKVYNFIPLLMSLFCIFFGIYILSSSSPDDFIAGHVVLFLGAVVLCIFSTASLMNRQYTHLITPRESIFYPILSFGISVVTVSYGLWIIFTSSQGFAFIAGHKVVGLGLICVCLAVETTVCTKFPLIKKNSTLPHGFSSPDGFSGLQTQILMFIALLATLIAWVWSSYLLLQSNNPDNFVAGHVMMGMAMICTSVCGMVGSGLRQINNHYKNTDKKLWPSIAITMGFLALIWGIILIILDKNPSTYLSPGFIMIGMSCICFSISSKLYMNSKIWKNKYKNINIIPFIPLFLYLACIFLSSFLFQGSATNINLYIPSRVLIGISTVCISLFAMTNIIRIINIEKIKTP